MRTCSHNIYVGPTFGLRDTGFAFSINYYKFTMSLNEDGICWREHLNNIEKMRRDRNAPVDSMGCEQICDKSAPPEVSELTCYL